ncbi:MarR family winged helix-turn-helix transcriptional regulator [Nocardia sp. NPDC059240]|uniref:MarR family winged helix-turn-helix transcriptional regulator n=1 Tax=Nocardia sp. NPDC059240 TaxID=3346786 RepID=UPI00369A0847
MNDVNGSTRIPGTVSYRLGVLGAIAENRFATAIAALDLKPKHVGLLAALESAAGLSQQELATRLGVVPSLVVALADHLERLGALRRERDPSDRRRQTLVLTDDGRALLARCEQEAATLDRTLTAGLTPAQLSALDEALSLLATAAGLPPR